MPLIEKIILPDEGVLGVWKTTEEDDFFLKGMTLFVEEQEEISPLKNRKKSEWLSSRYLLHLLSERESRGACLKDKYGKPYLKDSRYHISMSHSAQYTAVIASPYLVGIDIQVIVPKITRIASKFVGANEHFVHIDTNNIAALHVLWGAKESIYKAYGKKELNFKQHIQIENFVYQDSPFIFKGRLVKDNLFLEFTLFCNTINHLILVYAIQVQ